MSLAKEKEKLEDIVIVEEEEEVKVEEVEEPEVVEESSSGKFLVKTNKKRLGKKRTKYMSITTNDLPEKIEGKILENCIIRGANITCTRSHDIKLEKYVTQMLDSIKMLLEGKAVDGALGGAKLIAELVAGPGKTIVSELMEKLEGKGSVIVQQEIKDEAKLCFEGLTLADQEIEALKLELKQLKELVTKKFGFVNNSLLKNEKDSISGFAAIARELAAIEKGKQQKTKSLPKVPLSILKRDGHCVSMGCCVVLEKPQVINCYQTCKLQNLGINKGLPYHNAKGNWLDDEQCYIVAKRGYYQAQLIARTVLCGGGDRTAMIQIEFPPKPSSESEAESLVGRTMTFRGNKVIDSKLESQVFQCQTPEFLLEVGTRVHPMVNLRGPAPVVLAPLNTYFNVSALGNQSS